jgi:putative DNA primase/helicase
VKEGDAIAAVAKCFAAWLDRRGSTGPAEIAAGISQIRRFFEQHGQSRFADFYGADGERPIANRCGFKRQEDGKTEYYVLPESFRSELCAGLDVYAIARECIRLGLLIPASDGKPQRPERIRALLGETEKKRVYHFTSAIHRRSSK